MRAKAWAVGCRTVRSYKSDPLVEDIPGGQGVILPCERTCGGGTVSGNPGASPIGEIACKHDYRFGAARFGGPNIVTGLVRLGAQLGRECR